MNLMTSTIHLLKVIKSTKLFILSFIRLSHEEIRKKKHHGFFMNIIHKCISFNNFVLLDIVYKLITAAKFSIGVNKVNLTV